MEIIGYTRELNSCIEELVQQSGRIYGVINRLYGCCLGRGTVYIFGNGGSAVTSSHFARDISIGTQKDISLKAVSLTDVAAITSIGNDVGYDAIFAKYLKGRISDRDIAIGISASGNSQNILSGVLQARNQGAYTIGFIGFGGGKLKDIVELPIILSSKDYGIVEDTHLILCHIIAKLLKDKIDEY